MRKLLSAFVLFLALLVIQSPSWGQCTNTIKESCEVYPSCFQRYCPCEHDPNEYFKTYGEKYCKKFLQNPSFSTAGKRWRDTTLRCLQEAIVPRLDISENPKCDCKSMKAFAYDSHVACYTKTNASVCSLPLSDVNEIRKVIDIADSFTSEGWQQIKKVAEICKADAPDDGRRAIWGALHAILQLRQ